MEQESWESHSPERLKDGIYQTQMPDGSWLPVRQYTSPSAAKLASFALQLVDLRQAKASLSALINSVSAFPEAIWTDDLRAIFEGTVLAYCRCFDPSGGNRNSLNPGDTFAALPPESVQTHMHIWASRSKHYAHDVNGLRDAAVGVVLANDGFSISVPVMRADPPNNLLHDFARLIEGALAYCTAEHDRLLATVTEEVRILGPERVLKLPFLAHSLPSPDDHQASRRDKGHQPFYAKPT